MSGLATIVDINVYRSNKIIGLIVVLLTGLFLPPILIHEEHYIITNYED